MYEWLNVLLAYSEDADPLDNLSFGNPPISGETLDLFKNFVQSWYGLAITIGTAGFVITMMFVAFKLMLTGRNSRARQEIKEELKFKVIVALGLFALVSIVGVIGVIINNIIGV